MIRGEGERGRCEGRMTRDDSKSDDKKLHIAIGK